jgi:Mg-chelatase subunit ChlD
MKTKSYRPASTSGAASDVEDVVLVIDISSSMEDPDYPPSRIEAAKKAASDFVHQKFGVDHRDGVAVVTFGSHAHRECDLLNVGTNRKRIFQTIARLSPKGSTAMGDGLAEASDILERSAAPVRRVILLSDGHHNAGAEPEPIAERLKNRGVIIDTIGIGGRAAINEAQLKRLASTLGTELRYRYIDNSRELIRYFASLSAKVRRRPAAKGGLFHAGPKPTPLFGKPKPNRTAREEVPIILIDESDEKVEIKLINE